MAKNAIREYSTTAASNTDIGGIGIQGSNAVSNFDNAFRTIMAQLADMNAGNSPINDTFLLCDPVDSTKRVRIDAGSITTATTRVLTMPDFNITLGSAAAQNTGISGANVPLLNGNNTHSGTNTFSGQTQFTGARILGNATADVYDQYYVDSNTFVRWAYLTDNQVLLQQATTSAFTGATILMQFSTAGRLSVAGGITTDNIILTASGSGNNITVGDDARIGDVDLANTVGIKGQANPNSGFIKFGSSTAVLGISNGETNLRFGANGCLIQDNGDIFLPYASAFLSTVFATKANIHTGTTATETNYPLGYTLPMFTNGSSVNRNASASPALSAVDNILFREVGDLNAGTVLSGTWRARGMIGSDYCLVERVS